MPKIHISLSEKVHFLDENVQSCRNVNLLDIIMVNTLCIYE